jgi:hypothetical protein
VDQHGLRNQGQGKQGACVVVVGSRAGRHPGPGCVDSLVPHCTQTLGAPKLSAAAAAAARKGGGAAAANMAARSCGAGAPGAAPAASPGGGSGCCAAARCGLGGRGAAGGDAEPRRSLGRLSTTSASGQASGAASSTAVSSAERWGTAALRLCFLQGGGTVTGAMSALRNAGWSRRVHRTVTR